MDKICKNCRYWVKAPEMTIGIERTKVSTDEWFCGKSREMSFPAYGQDGKPIVTQASFGCNQWQGVALT